MPSLLPLLLGLLLGAATAEASCKAIKQQALARGGFIDAKYDCAPRLPPDLQHCTLHGLLTAYDGECGWLGGWGCWKDRDGYTWAISCPQETRIAPGAFREETELARDQAQQAEEFEWTRWHTMMLVWSILVGVSVAFVVNIWQIRNRTDKD